VTFWVNDGRWDVRLTSGAASADFGTNFSGFAASNFLLDLSTAASGAATVHATQVTFGDLAPNCTSQSGANSGLASWAGCRCTAATAPIFSFASSTSGSCAGSCPAGA